MSQMNECPVCFDAIDETKNCVVTECGHKFHCSCLMKNASFNGFNCPFCRTVMAEMPEDSDEEDDDYESDEEESDEEESDEDDEDTHSQKYNIIVENLQDLVNELYNNAVEEEDALEVIEIYKRSILLNKFLKNKIEKYNENREQELLSNEDKNIIVTENSKVVDNKNNIQTLNHLIESIEVIDGKQHILTIKNEIKKSNIFHNKHNREQVLKLMKHITVDNKSKNMVEEATKILSCKEKNE
jgi:hypothetical protein